VAKRRKTPAAKRNHEKKREKRVPGFQAKAGKKTLRSYEVGAMPIINHIIRRMRLPDILKNFLPDDPRSELPAYRTVLVLVRNLLIAREPIYGLGSWAARFAPDLLELCPREVERLNDDRAGRTLDQMFDALASELTVTVVRQVIDAFRIHLDELHNDSTSISFYGAYDQAQEERPVRGQQTLAINYGHSKDHRPDLKQLLFILTISDDGGVPIYFTSASGNTSDDTTHRQTWDLLCQLAGPDHDARFRADSLQRAIRELNELRERLSGPRTRFKDRKKVDEGVREIVKRLKEESLLIVTVEQREEATFRQAGKGRPGKNTKYVKQIKKRFEISWSLDPIRMAEAEATDGIFPLISNVDEMTPEEILRAYKRQPIIEKRFSQLKTDFAVAPIYLKSVTRIQGLLAVYFLALIVQTLLERELRQAMERAKIKSLPLYPEERACRCPTARKVIDLFDGIQRHELKQPGQETEVMVTELSPLQKQILGLLGIPAKSYGRQ